MSSLSPAAILYDAAGNALKIVTDGADLLLGAAAKLRNVAGTIVNPATEDKQDDSITKLTSIDGKDFATETTLAAVQADTTNIPLDPSREGGNLATLAGKDFSTETTLAAIKDTAGIKKIVDPLPAGTNNIGDVDVVSSALPAGAATEATLAAVQADTTNIPLDPAREGGNLATLAGKDFATETTLAAIKDTAGIKKIVDALPAGTNNIGDVDVVSSALPTGAATESTLASVLAQLDVALSTRALEAGGNLAAILTKLNTSLDVLLSTRASETTLGNVYTRQADGNQKTEVSEWIGSVAPTVGQKTMASSLPFALASDQPPIEVVETPVAGEKLVVEQVLNGGSPNLIVNGSVTPVVFALNADPADDIVLETLRLVFSAAFFAFNGAAFGKGGGALANGVDIDIVANGGTFTDTLSTLTVNEDFLRLTDFSISQAGSTDVLAGSLGLGSGVVLEAGTADKITVTINDNLTTGARGITYFTGTVYGSKV